MTALQDVLEKLERATPGPWASAHSFRGVYSQHPTPGPVQVCRAPEHFHDTWRSNAEAMVAAVNWLREHGPELMKMLDRHGAGDTEDAARYRALRQLAVSAWNGERPPIPEEKTPATFDNWVDQVVEAARAGERG